MTAVLTPRHAHNSQPQSHPAPGDRPRLTVIEGGRSAGSLRMARTYRRRRAVALVTVLVLGWLLVSALFAGTASLLGGTSPAPSSAVSDGGAAAGRYVVRGGDTLWSVARSLHVDGDIRDVMAELADQNGDGVLHPGQVLVIPADLES